MEKKKGNIDIIIRDRIARNMWTLFDKEKEKKRKKEIREKKEINDRLIKDTRTHKDKREKKIIISRKE